MPGRRKFLKKYSQPRPPDFWFVDCGLTRAWASSQQADATRNAVK